MQASLDYPACIACQLSISALASQDQIAITINSADGPIWAISESAVGAAGMSTISTVTDGPLARLSSVQLTCDTITVLASRFKPLRSHGPGPQIAPLIIKLYIWAFGKQQIRLGRAGAENSTIGFAFGHADMVGDWKWIGPGGLTTAWPP